MSSSSNRPAIEDITWVNNETVAFLGEGPGELHQVHELNLRTLKLMKVTDWPTNVRAYSLSADGRTIVFSAEKPGKPLFDRREVREGHFVSASDQLFQLIRQEKAGDVTSDELYLQNTDRSRSPRILKLLQGRIYPQADNPFISPDGRYVLIKVQITNPLEGWATYSDRTVQQLLRQQTTKGYSWLETYELIDTKTGHSRRLLDTPVRPDHQSEAVWLPDSHSVVVSNVFLPLEGVDPADTESRKSSAFTVEVGIFKAEIKEVTQEDLKLVGWDYAAQALLANNHTMFRFGSLNSPRKVEGFARYFRRTPTGWEEDPALAKNLSPPEILWKEGLNFPPTLYAVDPRSANSVLLLNPNPQFKHLTFGKLEEIHWEASDSHEIRGGLVYPVGYLPGRRYPLVLQTHGWLPDKFMVDGPFSTAFAAQALANRGIMVLQADERVDAFGTSGEPDAEQANYEGAIDYLDSRGMIDRERVGLIGFSRTCYHVKHMLTHSKYAIAAASVTDGVDGGYFQYMAFANGNPGLADLFDVIEGGRPFGDGLKSWLEKAPDFRLDRVRTPLLITALDPNYSVLGEWEWFAGLSRLGKPVEFLVLREGTHELEKPWDRLTSQQTNVDWFAFWLKGEEDTNPAKAEQYIRWRKLRAISNKTTSIATQ